MYLRCSCYASKLCKASYIVSMNEDGSFNKDIRCVVPHTHPPDELAVQTEKFLEELKKAVIFVKGNRREMYNFVAQSYPEVAKIYSYKFVAKRIYQWEKKARSCAYVDISDKIGQENQRKKFKYEKYGYQKPQIPIGRMGKLDFDDGFLYFKKIQYTDKLYIRCAMMNEIGCKASYVISVNGDGTYKNDMRCVTPHSHPPNELAVQTEKFLNELRKAVEIMPMSTHRIYNFVAQSFLLASVPTTKSVHGRYGKMDFNDGFLYFKLKRFKDKMYLRCAVNNNVNCKASYVIALEQGVPNVDKLKCLTPHNHPPDEIAVQAEKFLEQLKLATEAMNYYPPRKIYNSVIEGFPELAKFYPYRSVARRMRYWEQLIRS